MIPFDPRHFDVFFVVLPQSCIDSSTGSVSELSPLTPTLQQWIDGIPCYPVFTSSAAAVACMVRHCIQDCVVTCDRELIRRIVIELGVMCVAFDPPHTTGLIAESMATDAFLAAIS